jgi:hypothetical protein
MSKEQLIAWWDSNSSPERWCVDVLQKNSDGQYNIAFSSNGDPNFPINIKDFGPFEEDTLIQTLKGVFPGADIRLKF